MAVTRPALVVAAALVVLARPAAQQDDRYRTTTNLVSIYATVTDSTGRLVPDLTKDDFVVKDNGRKQPLAVFSNEAQPISVVVLLDTSGSMASHLETIQEGAAAFIKGLRPDDRARLGTFGAEIRLMPETFTADTGLLLDLLHQDVGLTHGSPIWTAIDRSITSLLSTGGRRVVLVFTDGQNDPLRGQVVTDLKDVIWRARVDDVMVYTIGFTDTERGPLFAPPGRIRGFGGGGNRVTEAEDARAARKALQELAGQTGAGYFEMKDSDKLARTFARVADELHRQYWLGIKPGALDDTMHKLEVTVPRRTVTVQARKSYFAGSFVK